MSRILVLVGLSMFTGSIAACGTSGVGDPCTLATPSPTASCEAGCFNGGEIYIETRSLQCRTRVCMIYHWDSVIDYADQPKREFCTCKCGGPGDPSSFCTCPRPDFTCTTVFTSGSPGIQGSYCVRSIILPDSGVAGDAGM